MMQVSPETSPRLMMNWDEIRGADAAGALIGAHTNTHPILSQLPSESQREEIQTSIETIKEKTGRSPEFFSYPEGGVASFNEETVQILKERGVRFAMTTEKGVNDPEDLPYFLKRIGMNPSDPVPVVVLKIALMGLRTQRHLRGLKGRKAQAGLKIRQYGHWNAAKRAFKAALRIIGIHFETYWILTRDLGSHIEAPAPVSGLAVKRLSYEDFEVSPFFNEFSPEKRNLLKQRFSSPDYQAFGAERDGALVYMTWIATDSLRIEAMHFEQELEQGEGVLLDSMTLPKARGLGIHTYMSWYRLERLKDKGVRKAFVAVMAENRPALRAQFKIGFVPREKLTWLTWGRFSRHFHTGLSGQQGSGRIDSSPTLN
jgi:GNAT superfamily N-acetyltransferase